MSDDPRLSDEATGLPPLEDVDPDSALLVLAWSASIGVVAVPDKAEPIAVRYLSVRGLTRSVAGDPMKVEWAQFHIAVPVEHAMDVAAALASGGMFQVTDEEPTDG